MHRPLFDKEKAAAGVAQDEKKSNAQNAEGGALSTKKEAEAAKIKAADAASQAFDPKDLSSKAWHKSHMALHETAQGRAAIRVFTRGIIGAAAFAWGGHYANRSTGLKGVVFNQETRKYVEAEYSFSYDLPGHNNWELHKNLHKPLVIIARGIDECIGRPIRWAVTKITKDELIGERAVRFRPMSAKFAPRAEKVVTGADGIERLVKAVPVKGRSLGEEVIGITFDFFSASVGDAFGRDLVDFLDPYAQKSWLDKKGQIRPSEAAKSMVKAAWRYLTYNGGEDWAVALPYAYFMKGQRAFINHISPGFELDANESLNGSSHKVKKRLDAAGTPIGADVVGDFNLEGAIDLQSRFTVYNIGTLMYREAYDWVGNRLRGKPTNLYGDPNEHREYKGLINTATDVAKWAVRSVIKGTLVMTPSVPFFWVTRVPQTSYKGTFIDPTDLSMLTYSKSSNKGKHEKQYGLVKVLLLQRSIDEAKLFGKGEGKMVFDNNTPVGFRQYDKHIENDSFLSPNNWLPGGPPNVGNNPMHNGFTPYGTNRPRSWFSKALRPFGKLNNDVRVSLRTSMLDHGIGPVGMSRFVNASASYTPYMYMKAEMANLFDTGKMDMATERMIDGAFHFNFGEFKAGAGEVLRTIRQKPLLDPVREAEGQYRIKSDTSGADTSLRAKADIIEERHRIRKIEQREQAERASISGEPGDIATTTSTSTGAVHSAPAEKSFTANTSTSSQNIPWEQRVIQGRAQSQKHDNYATAMAPAAISNAEREKMRKFLTEAVPPSNSKH